MAVSPMDVDCPSSPYKLLHDNMSERISVIIYMTEAHSHYGEADYNLLEPLWREMKFNVISIKDPTWIELNDKLNQIVEKINRNPEKHDQLAMTFVGHGDFDEILRNGKRFKHEYIKLTNSSVTVEDIKRKFYRSSCHGLTGKPFHLYIAACRGKNVERPYLTGYAAEKEESERSHCFTFYSSPPDIVSCYDLNTGSRFIQALVAIFREDYKTKHLVDMANRVINDIHQFLPSGFVQTPVIESNIKDLFLDGENGQRYLSSSLPVYVRNLPLQQLPPGYNYAATRTGPSDLSYAAPHSGAFNDKASEELWQAALRGCDAAAVARHIQAGADVNWRYPDGYGRRGRTSLHGAALYNHRATTRALLSAGADHTLRDDLGTTALGYARMQGNTEVIDILEPLET